MAGLFCSHCGTLNPPGAERCRSCRRSMEDCLNSVQMCITERLNVEPKEPKVLEKEDAEHPFFPYTPREGQLSMISDIVSAMDQGRHFVMESGTGTGKTIVSLAAALQHATSTGKKVVYLTRTISQSDQVMRELRAISKIADVSGITLTGRNKSCLLMRTMAGYEDMSPHALSNLCEDRKSKSAKGEGGCRFFDRLRRETDSITAFCKSEFPTSDKLDAYCEKLGVCPYEAKKVIMKGVDVVVAPYIHILSEDIRTNLLSNMGVDEGSIVLVVDEAHNLIDAAREQGSFSVHLNLIDSAIDESTAIRDPEFIPGVPLGVFLSTLKRVVRGIANDKLTITEREAVVSSDDVEGALMKALSLTRAMLETGIDRMLLLGEERTDLLMQNNDNRISELYTLGLALKDWMTSPEGSYIRMIRAGEDGEYLYAACIDPVQITGFMHLVKSALHMSGTLQPLEQYVRTMNLKKDTVTATYPSPFPQENRSVIYVKGLTTKYDEMKRDPSIRTRIHRTVAKLCNAVDKNTLVFFPSYRMMNDMRPFLERDVLKDKYWEESGRTRETMANLERFRSGSDGVFFTVMGGSIAEGIDFPGEELCFAVVVGIPYPPPTLESKAMSAMFDKRYGDGTGWRYTSEVPALRKMKQAIGRLIRTETDRGMAVIIDYRASKYIKQLDAHLSDDPVAEAREFFG